MFLDESVCEVEILLVCGFRVFKIKVGYFDLVVDVDVICVICEVVGKDVWVVVDFN